MPLPVARETDAEITNEELREQLLAELRQIRDKDKFSIYMGSNNLTVAQIIDHLEKQTEIGQKMLQLHERAISTGRDFEKERDLQHPVRKYFRDAIQRALSAVKR